MRRVLLTALAGLFCPLGIGASGSLDDKYIAQIESWRRSASERPEIGRRLAFGHGPALAAAR